MIKKVPIIDVNTGKVIHNIQEQKRKATQEREIELKIAQIVGKALRLNKYETTSLANNIYNEEIGALDIFQKVKGRPIEARKLMSLIFKDYENKGADDWVVRHKLLAPQLYGSVFDDGEEVLIAIYETGKFLFIGNVLFGRFDISTDKYLDNVNGKIQVGHEGGGVVLFKYKGKNLNMIW